jgi:hypothetical protein
MRLAVRAFLIGVVGLGGCHGATIHEVDGGQPTGAAGRGGGAGGRGGGAGTLTGGGGTTGGASGTAGGGGLPKTLTVVPGTGTPGIAFTRMTAFEGGTAYPAVLDIYDGDTVLSPLVVVKAVQLSNGAATSLSGPDEAGTITYDGKTVVAIDATYVYWFSRDSGDPYQLFRLRRAPKLGGGGAREDIYGIDQTQNGAPDVPLVMATGGGYVYWASAGNGIFRCPASVGCGTGPEAVVPTTDNVVTMVVRGDWLYWASETNGKVWRHGLTTPGDQMLDGGPTLGYPQTCDIAVSADDTELWSIQCLYPYEVRRVNISVMSGTTIANAPNETIDQTAAGALALGTDTVYFMGSDHVFSVPRGVTAATPQMLASLTTASGVHADAIIGLDDQYLYLQGSSGSSGSTNAKAGYVLRMAR